jgi:dipeptidase
MIRKVPALPHLWHASMILLLALFLAAYAVSAQQDPSQSFNCFSVLTGRHASADGSVLFAHNEDDYGTRIVNWYKVDRKLHDSAEIVSINNETGKIKQAQQTNAYLWLEIPEMESSDGYMNEYGVVIASNQCSSREDDPEITKGGIGYWLRRIMAEQATSAKHAVLIGGALVERFGYKDSGRSYCIADPDEAWVMAVVNGKHWVAQRVPDDRVAVVPNCYTLTKIDLADSANYLGSPDIISYATEKGWFNPSKDGEFNFRKAYSDPSLLEHPSNINRMWRAISMTSLYEFKITDELPFAFLPREKISLTDLMGVLRDHYEGTPLDLTNNYQDTNPHFTANDPVCSPTTQYGFVAQLRNYMPVEIGAVLWIAPFRPCVHPFIPWYAGIDEIPAGYFKGNVSTALEQHFNIPEDLYIENDSLAYWYFVKHMNYIDEDYGKRFKKERNRSESYERSLMQKQIPFERDLLYNYRNDPFVLKEKLTGFTSESAQGALKLFDSGGRIK